MKKLQQKISRADNPVLNFKTNLSTFFGLPFLMLIKTLQGTFKCMSLNSSLNVF